MRRLKELYKKDCKKIRLVITDVDGVLTDGGRYYSKSGEKLKKFHVRDGMAVNLLLRNGIKTIILTKERSEIVKKWSKDMNVSKIFMGSIYNEINEKAKKYFKKIVKYKPLSSKKESKEIYIFCKGILKTWYIDLNSLII